MDLSPLNQLVGMFGGAESLGGFGPGSYQGPGKRVRGNSRLFAEFYNLKTAEQRAIPEFVKKIPLNNGVVRETPTKWEIVPIERLMVRVIDPGDKYNIVDCVATHEHKAEFYPEYEAFMSGRTKPVGRELTEAPFITEGIKLELNRMKIFTLEQLRDASDSAMQVLGVDNYHIREQAGQWLESSETNEDKKRVLDLEAQLKKLTAQFEAREAKVSSPVQTRKKRGPNKKKVTKENEETTSTSA